MPSIVEQSLCNAVDRLGEMVDTHRQEIRGLHSEIDYLRTQLTFSKSREKALVKEIEHYKMLVSNLEANQK